MTGRVDFCVEAVVVMMVAVGCTSSPSAEPEERPLPRPTVSERVSDGARPQYLAFQVFTNTLVPDGGYRRLLDHFTDDLVDRVGERGEGDRHLAFTVGPISWNHGDEQIVDLIATSFDIAEEKDLAVLFHIDESKFWDQHSDLLADPANVEWTDWGGLSDESVVSRASSLVWNDSGGEEIAPQMCLTAPQIRAEAARLAGDVIGSAIASELASREGMDIDALFGGVIVGWETELLSDADTGVPGGFCALHHLGYGPDNEPADVDAALEGVISDWLTLWAASLEAAGVPPGLLYTHIAAPLEPNVDNADDADLSHSIRSGYSPLQVATDIESLVPGFSLYPEPGRVEEVRSLVESRAQRPWVISEGTNVPIAFDQGSFPQAMETYLAQSFNYGAIMVNLFAWGLTDAPDNFTRQFALATETDEAIDTYRKFLQGQPLIEQAEPADAFAGIRNQNAVLAGKVQTVIAELRELGLGGHDITPIQPTLDELDQAVRTGDLDTIVNAVEAIEAFLEAAR